MGMALGQGVWLVRSGGRIIGPFEKAQVSELLKSREIQLRDEIATPLSRWFPVEFHPELSDEVENFKREVLTEKTEFSFTPTESGLTQTATDLVDSELTEEITQDLSGFTNTREIVVNHVQETSTPSKRNLESAQYQLKGLEASPYVKGRSHRISLLIQLGALCCGLAIAAFLFLRFQERKPAVEKLSVSQVRTVVLKLVERGEYPEALRLMQSKRDEPGFNEQLGVFYALLSLQLEGQSLTARRILEDLLISQPELRVHALTGIGLSYLLDQNYSQANIQFENALQEENNFRPAQVDRLIGSYLSQSSIQIGDFLSENWLRSEAEALLTLALQATRHSVPAVQEVALAKSLEVHASQAYNYQLEAKFLLSFLNWKKTGQPQVKIWGEIVDSDPFLTDLHRHNVFIYRGHLSWAALFPLCQKMVQKREEVESRLLNVFCLYKAGRFQEARVKAEAIVDRNPKDGLGLAWYALTLKDSGSPDQSSVILGRALESDRKQSYQLPLLLQGRFCENSQNKDCAYETWKSLLEVDYNNLAALAGLAKLNHQQKSREEAEKLLARGLSLSPDYKSFLALKDEWSTRL